MRVEELCFQLSGNTYKITFDVDRFGNEIIPKQVAITEWSKVTAEDASHLQADPLKFHLKKGSNEITLSNLKRRNARWKSVCSFPK